MATSIMISQTLHPSQQHDPSQSTPSMPPTIPLDEQLPSSNHAPDLDKDKETVYGWLVNRSTLQTCLVVHKNKEAIVGRHTASDLVLTEGTISNRHCKLFTNTSGFVLCEDMSTNGTYWNGNLIGKGESVILSHGDSIRIRTRYHFIFQDFLKATARHIDPEIGTVEKMYQILPQTLGKGTFAKVNLAIHRKTKVQLAVKIMDRIRYSKPENSGGTDIEKEVAILRTVDHPNIIPVVDVIKTTRFIYIFLQMLSGGDLFEYVVSRGPLPEFEAKFVVYQTLQALKHLHNMNISHRDLKPENLMLTSATKYPRVLLTDFGMAREFAQERLMSTMCGTFAYMAPEVFDAKHAGGPGYGSTADCWSLGVMIYVILSGTHPFTTNYSNENEASMRQKMRSRNLSFPPRYWKGISIEARSLIRCLLILDPEERWTVEDALNSEWIQKDAAWLRQRYRETVWGHWIKSSLRLRNVLQHTTTTTNMPDNKPSKREQTDSWAQSQAKRFASAGQSQSDNDSLSSLMVHVSSIASSMMCVPDISTSASAVRRG